MPTQKQLEALQLWRVAEGKPANVGGHTPTRRERERAQILFSESIAYGDLPTQLQPAIIRTLQQVYENTPSVTEQFTRLWTLQGIDVDEQYDIFDFNQDNIPGTNDGKSFIKGGLPAIGRRESYPQLGLSASGKYGRVGKFGEAFGIDWEAVVNSRGRQVNLVRRAIERFGRDARGENEIQVAKLLVDSNSFATGSGQGLNGAHALTGNPDLTDPLDVAAAIAELKALKVAGVTTTYSKYVILASPGNAPGIRQGLSAKRVTRNPGVTSGPSWEETLDLGADVEVIEFPYLERIWSSIGKGAVIVPVASDDQLPVLTRNRLDGYEQPSFWIKDSNARNASGGAVNPEVDGDFDSDAVVSKVRHVTGASALWVEQVGYTTGANS